VDFGDPVQEGGQGFGDLGGGLLPMGAFEVDQIYSVGGTGVHAKAATVYALGSVDLTVLRVRSPGGAYHDTCAILRTKFDIPSGKQSFLLL
jgi:hypothetical protein